jgi:uncharacterized membrane protein YbhN (UPF0104 family)
VDQSSAIAIEPAERSWVADRWRLILGLAILLAFTAWAVWYISRHWRDFVVLADVPGWSLLGLVAISAGIVICNGLYIKFALQAFGVNLPAREWLSLTVATSVLNYFTPLRGGMAMRAMYLKTRHRFSYTDFISSLSAMYLMYVAVYGIIGVVGMAVLWEAGHGFDPPLAVFFLISTGTAAILMLCRLPLPKWEVFPFRQIARVIEGWALLRRDRANFAMLLFVTIVFALLSLLAVQVASSAINLQLSWGGIMLYTAGQNLAMLASITPAALGVAEMVSIYMGLVLGYNVPQALMVQALLRAVPLALLLVAALPAFYALARRRHEGAPSDSASELVRLGSRGGDDRYGDDRR